MLSETSLLNRTSNGNPAGQMIFKQRRFMGLLLAKLYGWYHRFTSFIYPPAHSINTRTIWNGWATDEMNASLNKWQKITKACYLNSRFSLPRKASIQISNKKMMANIESCRWWSSKETNEMPSKGIDVSMQVSWVHFSSIF